MINCLLIKVTNNARGLPVRSYHTLVASELTIGRSAESIIHLADPRIAMHHAVIKYFDDGQIYLVSINGELSVNGAMLQNIPLTAAKQIRVGPYLLSVEPTPPDINLSISLTLVNKLPDDYQDLKARTHDPLPNAFRFKWRLSFWLAIIIALIAIALPLAQNFIPQLHDAIVELPFGFDRVWSPERTSSAHRHFGSQCFNCHQTPFKKVADSACMHCHQDTARHIKDPQLHQRAFKAAHRFVGSMRCAECHQEHKAPYPLAKQDNQMCINCHGKIKNIDANTALPNIRDFNHDHPDFKLSFITGHDLATHIERIPQKDTARLIEQSGIKFPHKAHIGKVQGPDGIWDVRELSCTSCHQPEGKEMRFKPLSFKTNCVQCHTAQLQVGAKETRVTLPHGDEQNVFNALKVHAAKDFARYSESLKKNGCAYCHEIKESSDKKETPWRVVPLRINQDWFSKAQFSHGSHQSQKCVACHNVENSESSADVAMPDRQSCLQCHAGNNHKHKRIASSCMSCHDFHNAHRTNRAMIGEKLSDQEVDSLLSAPNAQNNASSK